MTFSDLPKDWRRRPLSDTVLAADVVDLYCTEGDRRRGALLLLIADHHDLFKGAIVVPLAALTERPLTSALRPVVKPLIVYPEGSLVLALARTEPTPDTDLDWATAAATVCHQLAVRLLGFYVASHLTTHRLDQPVSSGSSGSVAA